MSRWVEVPETVAAAHPLQGMRRALRFFSLWIALTAIGGVVLAVRDIRTLADASALAGRPDAAAEAVFGLVVSALQLVMAVLWFRLWRHFRLAFAGLVAIAILVAIGFDAWAWHALAALPPGQRSAAERDLVEQVASDVVGTAGLLVLLVYMQRSRRFRVTFENRVRPDDDLLRAGR